MARSSSVVFLLSLLLLPATPTSSQCIGMPCQYKGECRSKLGECGTTTAHCDAESQWVAACGGGSELVGPAVVIDTTANTNNNNNQQQSTTTFHPMDTNRDGYIEQAEIDAASTNTIPQQQQQQQQQQTQNMQTTSSGAMDASQQVVVTTTTTATATIPPSATTQTSLGQEGAVSVEDNAAAAEQAKIKEAIDQELNEASELLSPTSIESGQQQTQLQQQQQQQQQQTPTISPITLWEEWSNQQYGGSTGSTSNTDSSSSSSSTIYQHPNTNETEGWGDLNAWDNGRTEKEDGGVFDMMEDYVFGEDDTSSSSSSSLSTFGSGTMMSIEGRIMTTLVLFKSMLLLLGY